MLLLFFVFVVLDSATTYWLILNSPGGIFNEVNPLGVLLYKELGLAGMVLSKIGVFTLFTGLAFYYTSRYRDIRWFDEVFQILVLCLMAVSIVVVFNNFIAILATLLIHRVWPILEIPRWSAAALLYAADMVLAVTFANGVLYIWNLSDRLLHLRVIAGLLLFTSPVMIFAEGFKAYLWLDVLYVASSSAAVALAFYLIECGGKGRIRFR